jgi:sphinganine-1-phosphate aldolase
MGKPAMSVFAVASRTLDMYAIGKGMEDRGWIVYMDSEPVPALRFMQSPGHEPYVDAYMADLREVVQRVRSGELTTTEGRARYT